MLEGVGGIAGGLLKIEKVHFDSNFIELFEIVEMLPHFHSFYKLEELAPPLVEAIFKSLLYYNLAGRHTKLLQFSALCCLVKEGQCTRLNCTI